MLGLARAMVWALSGIGYAIKTQRNMKIHIFVALLVFAVCYFLALPPAELAVISLTIFLVLAAEMFNTAIEAAVDLITQNRHPLAKIAKDVSAGAVLLAAINALVVAYIIIWPRIADILR